MVETKALILEKTVGHELGEILATASRGRFTHTRRRFVYPSAAALGAIGSREAANTAASAQSRHRSGLSVQRGGRAHCCCWMEWSEVTLIPVPAQARPNPPIPCLLPVSVPLLLLHGADCFSLGSGSGSGSCSFTLIASLRVKNIL
ncbi:hypothetical protein chiPu_0006838 [Chiloscyllium punctatum]|uniref:Uncharacterized protein n=1 Tax=Chiloscyllium punctatum TaxID=137246 RepID=A0A401SDE0_CHIPU|nr:hypothetical protein [Chiloscyllium punctatum]